MLAATKVACTPFSSGRPSPNELIMRVVYVFLVSRCPNTNTVKTNYETKLFHSCPVFFILNIVNPNTELYDIKTIPKQIIKQNIKIVKNLI